MNKRSFYLFLVLSLLMFSCDNAMQENSSSDNDTEQPSTEELAEGLQLLEANCYACHSPNASMENRLAPPMIAIKKHYLTEGVSLEQFTEDLASFLNDPSEEKSKMPGALRRFNLMPKMSFSDDHISKIATYMYYTDIEQPDWFEEHYKQEKGKQKESMEEELSPLALGQNFALKTKSVLGKNLMGAITSQGTEHAVSFCSTRAIPLTDSVALSVNAQIKRVSDKNRNKDNKANKEELAYIQKTKLAISKGESPKPQLVEHGNKQVGYYPIVTNKMCLQCHGQLDEDISPKTFRKIKTRYPNDSATGYKANELRGIWVVEMDKK